MIIFGTRARNKEIGSGRFYCPHCQKERDYAHMQGRNYFALYFIPIFPIGDSGEFIQCKSCRRTYAPEVLKFKPTITTAQSDMARLLNTVKERFSKRQPVEYVVSELTAEGIDREIAENIVTMVIGDKRRVCPQCDLTYAPDIEKCPDCGVALKEPA
jgi:hypothetical protein